ncbi:hypothetical protein BDP27DRAFT_1375884 [Rhodocollybia butyracea]|uniref:Uncharacterized protein n=1 Tax=Rhodocollybia butyracea TaxID=206335 RepID=A0A9P5P5E4_9AGAR|nr:hypothetical protein BDP27DRAFT_1375884 [Rhodocollybia butyracea]
MSSHTQNYPWRAEYQSMWMLEGRDEYYNEGFWQKFYDHWKVQDNPLSSKQDQLQIVPEGISLNTFPQLTDICAGAILVLPEYCEMVQRIVKVYNNEPKCAVVVTGQPGIRKSVLLSYLLAILLSIPMDGSQDSATSLRSALVLLYTTTCKFLFYDSKAWFPNSATDPSGQLNLSALPEPSSGVPRLWVLIDMDDKEEPRGLAKQSTVFLVQAALPCHFATWTKTRHALFFGLPLWQDQSIYHGWELLSTRPDFEMKIESWIRGDEDATIFPEHQKLFEAKGKPNHLA